MKLKLPNGNKISLSPINNVDERILFISGLISQFDDFIVENYDTQQVQYFLEGCSNYIVWCKDDENGVSHDKTILQREKTLKLNKYDKHEIPFSSLTKDDKFKYGLEESEEFE